MEFIVWTRLALGLQICLSLSSQCWIKNLHQAWLASLKPTQLWRLCLTCQWELAARLKSECSLKILSSSVCVYVCGLSRSYLTLDCPLQFHTCYMILIASFLFEENVVSAENLSCGDTDSHYFQAEVNRFDLNKNLTTLILSQVFVNLQFSLTNN